MLLLTSAESRKCFDLFNIFNSKNENIILSSDQSIFLRGLLSLIYLKRVRKTAKILRQVKLDLLDIKVLPVEESDIELMYSLGIQNQAMLPDQDAFFSVVDKLSLYRQSQKYNIPCPVTLNLTDIDSVIIEGNLVVKPIRGMGSEGVKFFDNFTDAKKYFKLLKDPSDFLLQEKISDNKVRAGCFLFDKGILVSFYAHERLRTFPSSGGVTVCSVSILDKRIMELGQILLGNLNWSGLAMIEFMWSDKINDYQMIEVNPRPWGSIMLSERCASNMLMNYVDLLFGRPVNKSIGNMGYYIKWLLPYDFVNILRRKVSLKNYILEGRMHSCYINISYSNALRSMFWHLFQTLRLGTAIKKWLKW